MIPFALELGVEEMPSGVMPDLVRQLDAALTEALTRHRLACRDLAVDASPRRLWATGHVAARQEAELRVVKGPPLERARQADGSWSAAAAGFARRVGLPVDALAEGEGDERGYLVATVVSPTEPADRVLARLWHEAAGALTAPRTMRWTEHDWRFVRPVRWILALVGDAVLDVSEFGLKADARTYGNRTDHPGPVAVGRADQYRPALMAAGVELSTAERRRRIRDGGEALAQTVGGRLAVHPGLLEEVANLVEWPTPFLGHFDPEFLTVPAPVLETAMVHHQRYFPIRDEAGRLLPAFVGVRNGEGVDLAQVRAGNEKVLRARLADARFFYAEDRKRPLADRVTDLDGVVFHGRLGTYGDKRRRMRALAEAVGPDLGLDAGEMEALATAVDLAKADLLTRVVGEFPELEGIMGGVYARQEGVSAQVADAVAEQYHPEGPEDRLPAGRVGQALALLDRLDTLAGFQRAGLKPRGSEDPFALRRAGLGVVRLLMEGALAPVDLGDLVRAALFVHEADDPAVAEDLADFLRARARGYWTGRFRGDVIEAALAGSAPLASLPQRLAALAERLDRDDFTTLVVAFKRASHLSRGTPPASGGQYSDPAERALGEALAQARAASDPLAAGQAYWDAATALGAPVDRFFADVLVMDPDPAVRARRLGLLAAVAEFLRRGADLGRITGERGGIG